MKKYFWIVLSALFLVACGKDQAEEAARADRRQNVKDLDDDPFCRLFDELCK